MAFSGVVEMTRTQEMKLSLSIVIMILMMTGGVIAAHFMGIAAAETKSKEYTETKVSNLRLEMTEKLQRIHQQSIDNGKAIVRIETKLER
jgi:uncharacterized protein involved in cysteine biosynthesis